MIVIFLVQESKKNVANGCSSPIFKLARFFNHLPLIILKLNVTVDNSVT
jgi:hypothetical protein